LKSNEKLEQDILNLILFKCSVGERLGTSVGPIILIVVTKMKELKEYRR